MGGCITMQRRYPVWHFCWFGHSHRFAGLVTQQNTSTSQCLTAKCHDLLPPFFTCCPLHLWFEISTSLGGGSPPSPLKLQELLRNVEVIVTASAAGWFVGQLAYSVNFLLLDRWAMLEMKSIWSGGRPSSNPKEFVWEFQNDKIIINYCWCLFGVIQTNVGNIMQHLFAALETVCGKIFQTKTWRPSVVVFRAPEWTIRHLDNFFKRKSIALYDWIMISCWPLLFPLRNFFESMVQQPEKAGELYLGGLATLLQCISGRVFVFWGFLTLHTWA